MRQLQIILLIFLFSFVIFSCGEKEEYESWEKKVTLPYRLRLILLLQEQLDWSLSTGLPSVVQEVTRYTGTTPPELVRPALP